MALEPATTLRLYTDDEAALLVNTPLIAARTPATPSAWFVRRFPAAFQQHGSPFLEASTTDVHGINRVVAVEMNVEFFAAIIGGDQRLNHRVVFYPPDRRFYFKDVDGLFHPVVEERLESLLASLLLRCAQEMPANVNVASMFVDFRSTAKLQQVIRKARSTLMVAADFFAVGSANRRVDGVELIDQTAAAFVDAEVLKAEDAKAQLSLREVFEAFQRFCHCHGVVLKREHQRGLKRLIVEIVDQRHGLGLRHDVTGRDGRCTRGWRGLAFNNRLDVEVAAVRRN